MLCGFCGKQMRARQARETLDGVELHKACADEVREAWELGIRVILSNPVRVREEHL